MWGDNSYGQCGTEAANSSAVGDSEMSAPLGPAQGFHGVAVALGECAMPPRRRATAVYLTPQLRASRRAASHADLRKQLGRQKGAEFDGFPLEVRCCALSPRTLPARSALANLAASDRSHTLSTAPSPPRLAQAQLPFESGERPALLAAGAHFGAALSDRGN
eukprot:5372092-Prymnesium_polylepis.1